MFQHVGIHSSLKGKVQKLKVGASTEHLRYLKHQALEAIGQLQISLIKACCLFVHQNMYVLSGFVIHFFA